jgi:hypothetical protein
MVEEDGTSPTAFLDNAPQVLWLCRLSQSPVMSVVMAPAHHLSAKARPKRIAYVAPSWVSRIAVSGALRLRDGQPQVRVFSDDAAARAWLLE